jgi:putative PIN family toxin of toxin-antitoxin system
MIIVLDTNVLVSALLSPFGPAARILDLILAGDVRLAYDDRIMAEYRQVLARPKFSFDPQAVADVLAYMNAEGEAVVARPLSVELPDPDDLAFLEVATQAGALLISGNLHHFPEEARGHTRVLTPRDFLVAWSTAPHPSE